jgi:hypothetical protein
MILAVLLNFIVRMWTLIVATRKGSDEVLGYRYESEKHFFGEAADVIVPSDSSWD